MSILTSWLGVREADEEMARANAKPLDAVKIDAYVKQLKLAVRDGQAFESVYTEIEGDTTLAAAEVVAIAQAFVGGSKPKSRKVALASIRQERLRVSHAKSKSESAAKARTW